MVKPIISGIIIERLDQVLIGRFTLAVCIAATFFANEISTKGPFFMERGTPISSKNYLRFASTTMALLQNHISCSFITPCLITFSGLTPRRNWMAATRGFTFTTTMRVINWIHGNATNRWTYTPPTCSASLS
jgi:hypothetical protein